jgi:hypothetical protein
LRGLLGVVGHEQDRFDFQVAQDFGSTDITACVGWISEPYVSIRLRYSLCYQGAALQEREVTVVFAFLIQPDDDAAPGISDFFLVKLFPFAL